jgi:hypothetical protein
MLEPFGGLFCGHALSKVYQHVVTNEKVAHMLHYANIKVVQVDTKKCNTWPKFFEGKLAWD